MRKFIIAGMLAAIALPAAAPALAQSGPNRDYRSNDNGDQRVDRNNDRPGDRRGGPRGDRDGRPDQNGRHDDRRDPRGDNRQDRGGGGRGYDYNNPDPRYGNYQANRYYKQGNYKSRRLGANDRVYRGSDNRYYCRRQDGTTGLIIGGLGGGILGNVIAPGGSKTLGTILGGAGGALLGRSVDRNNVTCR